MLTTYIEPILYNNFEGHPFFSKLNQASKKMNNPTAIILCNPISSSVIKELEDQKLNMVKTLAEWSDDKIYITSQLDKFNLENSKTAFKTVFIIDPIGSIAPLKLSFMKQSNVTVHYLTTTAALDTLIFNEFKNETNCFFNTYSFLDKRLSRVLELLFGGHSTIYTALSGTDIAIQKFFTPLNYIFHRSDGSTEIYNLETKRMIPLSEEEIIKRSDFNTDSKLVKLEQLDRELEIEWQKKQTEFFEEKFETLMTQVNSFSMQMLKQFSDLNSSIQEINQTNLESLSSETELYDDNDPLAYFRIGN